jgi:predicted phage tail protein
VVAGVTYRYRVRAFNAAGDSSYSNTATVSVPAAATVPAAPTSLTLTVASASRVDVAWTDGSSNESGFKIERSRNGGAFTQVATVAANVTTYADTQVVSGSTYSYRVRAFNTEGNSAYSNVATAKVATPSAPSTLTATVATTGPRVNLAWRDTATNESGFEIYRATGTGPTYVRIATVGPNVVAFSDSTVTANTSYKYRVRAYNGVGASSYSNTINVTAR